MKRSGCAGDDLAVVRRPGRGSPGAWSAPRCTRSAAPRPSSAKNLSALKPGVQQTRPPAESGASTAGDQAVDVEQRHDVEAAIVGVEAPACRAMLPALRRDVALVSGTIFGRDVVPEVCRTSAMSSACGPAAGSAPAPPIRRVGARSVNAPAPLLRRRQQVDDGDAAASRRRRWRARSAPCSTIRAFALEVGQVELELVGAVGRVERRGGRAAGDGDEGGAPSPARWRARWRRGRCGRCRGRSAPPTVRAIERAQAAVGERRRSRRADGRRVVGAGGQQFGQGGATFHGLSFRGTYLRMRRAGSSGNPVRRARSSPGA